ncbi:hypothetical protein LXL04_004563 [Taraxacum kok-saghyz]
MKLTIPAHTQTKAFRSWHIWETNKMRSMIILYTKPIPMMAFPQDVATLNSSRYKKERRGASDPVNKGRIGAERLLNLGRNYKRRFLPFIISRTSQFLKV